MKIHKSTIERPEGFSIDNLEAGRARITMKGEDPEGIWVRKDPENKVMYLANDAVMFFPMPSWGMELPLCEEIDLYPYRGDTYNDTEFTVCNEVYEHLTKSNFIKEDDEFDVTLYLNTWQKEAEKLSEEEKENKG